MKTLTILKKHWAGALLIMLMSAAVALATSLLQAPLYRASARMLILQKSDGEIDAFTLSRASEKLADNLSAVISTSSFFNKVAASGLVGAEDFPRDEIQRREEWDRTVETSLVPQSSIFEINVRYPDREKAGKIIAGIEGVLLVSGPEFLGFDKDSVTIQVVDAPVTYPRPVSPSLPLNTLAGAVIGLVIAYGYATVRELIALPRAQATIPVAAEVQAPAHYESSSPVRIISAPEDQYRTAKPAATISAAPEARSEKARTGKVHTMFDDMKEPFGNQYFFENRVVQLEEQI